MRCLRPLAFIVALASCTQDFALFDPSTPDANVADATDGSSVTDGGDIGAGLVAYYKFDETTGTSCADSSGNNHTATLAGGATFSNGLQNNAVTLSGNAQYVSVPAGIVNGLSAFSISVWVNLTATPNWTRIFDFGTGQTVYMFLSPRTQTSTVRFAITTGGNANGVEQRLEAPPLATGSWQHVAVTLAGTTGTLYVNGGSVAQGPITLTPSALGNTTQDSFGRSQFPADPYLSGQIDNFRIYSRALSSSEVQQLFQQKQ